MNNKKSYDNSNLKNMRPEYLKQKIKINKLNVGDIVRIKTPFAFKVNPRCHYGEVVETNLNDFGIEEIRIKVDMKYTHDSFIWINADYYEKMASRKQRTLWKLNK